MTIDEAIKHTEEKAKEFESACALWKRLADEKGLSVPSAYEPCKKCAEEYRQLAKWLKELKQLRDQTRWIPIKTRPLTEEEKEYYAQHGAYYFDSIFDCHLPEDGQEVLITTKYETVDKVVFHNEGDYGSYFECYEDEGEVLAWRPLPEPHKEKGGEEE